MLQARSELRDTVCDLNGFKAPIHLPCNPSKNPTLRSPVRPLKSRNTQNFFWPESTAGKPHYGEFSSAIWAASDFNARANRAAASDFKIQSMRSTAAPVG
jgi:hypothetical protein